MADFTAAQRKQLAAKGQAMPDGSYPIRNAADLRNAARDWIRTGHPATVRAWIVKRAGELNVPLDSLPGFSDKEGLGDQPAASDELDVARTHMKARSAR